MSRLLLYTTRVKFTRENLYIPRDDKSTSVGNAVYFIISYAWQINIHVDINITIYMTCINSIITRVDVQGVLETFGNYNYFCS